MYICNVYKRNYIFILFLLIGMAVQAQPTMDTIKNNFKKKPRLFAKLDTRNSFINNNRAKIIGLKLGVSYGNRILMGIGYNQLYPPAKDFDKPIHYINTAGKNDSVNGRLRLYYLSAYFEYVFYQTKQWSLSMPLQFGIGKTYYKYEVLGQKRVGEENLNLIYEPAVSVGYKFVNWLGVGADIGFRFMVTSDRRLNQQFISPMYAFKVMVYYGELYKMVFHKLKK